MVEIFPPQTVLTEGVATDELSARGLEAFGLMVPALSPVWAQVDPAADAFDANALTLRLSSLRAPFRGIRSFTTAPHAFAGPGGAALSGPALVFALHPQAAQRLEALADARFGQPRQRPVPVAMLVRDATIPAVPPAPERFLASEDLDPGDGPKEVSFHDARGLIIDPIAVAHMLRALLTWRPGLLSTLGAETVGSAGGLDAVADLASGTLVHVIDPHGHGFRPTGAAARLKVTDGEDAEVTEVPDGGLVELASNQGLGRATGDDPEDAGEPPLRWGWALSGTLGRARLAPPALPAGVTLGRQFLRAAAVELPWHLRGNRSASPLRGIPPHDGPDEAWMLPAIRDPVPGFTLLSDGMQVLGTMGAMVSSFPGGAANYFAIAVSPTQDAGLALPPSAGADGRWPDFPEPGAGGDLTPASDPRVGLTARWRAGADRDVVLVIPQTSLPQGCHVRAYPRRFVSIAAIGEEQSFVRGDGGAAIRVEGDPTRLLLSNPFGLGPAEAQPNPAVLTLDLVIVTRNGRRRLLSSVAVPVATDTAEDMPDGAPAMGGSPLMTPALDEALTDLGTRGIAPTPLFGLPRPDASLNEAPPASVLELVRRLASEGQPRQGPRLPTQARFETVLALGTVPAGEEALAWQVVLTGARLDAESRCAQPEMGNPGNPAGPDVHATGVAFGGRLAYDAALAALRRAQPVLPFEANLSAWLVSLGGNNWNLPPADTSGTVAATLLTTVAALCDTPELALMPDIPPGTSVQGSVDALAAAMNLPSSPTVSVVNADERLIPELRREQSIAKQGRRDALWALARAFGEARELVYIEGPAFAATARPAGGAPHAIDLVETLAERLAANPALKVLICVPRHPDFALDRTNWVWTALAHRRDAIESLAAVASSRVAAFHPIGFPGRPTAIRSSTVIVDDAWCMTGATHLRRRGMTFDGSLAVAAFDRAMENGYSASIADFRRRAMAARLGVAPATAVADATSYWTRLERPDSAFNLVADLLEQGGGGRCSPVWAGPADITDTTDVADPDGTAGTDFVTLLAGLLADD